MCDFISWIVYKKEVLVITNKEMDSKRARELKQANPRFFDDAIGHGTLRDFYGLRKEQGTRHEAVGGVPQDYPRKIVNAIKKGLFSKVPGAYTELWLVGNARIRFEAYKDALHDVYHHPNNSADDKMSKLMYVEMITAKFWETWKNPENRIEAWR